MLAIEFSQRGGGIALRVGDDVRQADLPPGERADAWLMAALDDLFRDAGRLPSDLASVGVSIGPGGFTGLRVSIATAKMLALACGARLAGVPSALVAAGSCPDPGPILVVLAARNETFWADRLVRGEGAWVSSGKPGACAPGAPAIEVLLQGVSLVLADEHCPAPVRDACDAAGLEVRAPTFDPRACLAATDRMVAAGATTPASELLPIYLRPPEAVIPKAVREGRPGVFGL